MTLPTCKTCRHWKRELKNKRLASHGICAIAAFLRAEDDYDSQEYPRPVNIVVSDESDDSDNLNDQPLDANGMGALDGSGYWGAVVTGPDFGCVKHEAKE